MPGPPPPVGGPLTEPVSFFFSQGVCHASVRQERREVRQGRRRPDRRRVRGHVGPHHRRVHRGDHHPRHEGQRHLPERRQLAAGRQLNDDRLTTTAPGGRHACVARRGRCVFRSTLFLPPLRQPLPQHRLVPAVGRLVVPPLLRQILLLHDAAL